MAVSEQVIFAFNPNNQLIVGRRGSGSGMDSPFVAVTYDVAVKKLEEIFPRHTKPVFAYAVEGIRDVAFTQIPEGVGEMPSDLVFYTLEQLETMARTPGLLDTRFVKALEKITPHLIKVPYLHLKERDFIFRFRSDKDREQHYAPDVEFGTLYQSNLCSFIKAIARKQEGSAADPVEFDFGPVQYVLPSHFGFCFGVKNAIDRAYETLATAGGRRVFMLSELIHNPFVNEDLGRRGLRYLQTEKGAPLTLSGKKAEDAPEEPLLWDTLTPDDIVLIPAFGATDKDKLRLIRKGINIYQADATCMLVEKVWKAAHAYGRSGYTVIIHGKYEHEETKASFSNAQRYAPALIIRDMTEARVLGDIVSSPDPAFRATFYERFSGRFTAGFDVDRDLEYIALVNQTTLLVNETRAIVKYLTGIYQKKYGMPVSGEKPRVGGDRSDTLCYATQVNQDALHKALDKPVDTAFVIGGKNSSNTYQLYRLCEQKLGEHAYYIQSEEQIRSIAEVEHYLFPSPGDSKARKTILRPLWPGFLDELKDHPPKRVLLTGGASCPDGIIQQVITRINSLFPAETVRSPDEVINSMKKKYLNASTALKG